ncbi:hypothetical protein [Mycobacterium lacus]|uniref:Uncharacterized protein n=1 Tax=Mycobacterium lacus TaxID=169765 RepID=A0A1X1Y824_9MYCO|nr:hypothetical protein [Mycobacterium lacus]MCV7123524.1 hypothetical protein [Mycobacterium lacus]ORW07267.1 hypothetical protein AWC15_20225 [Mycobacterium lacus]BBX98686.1 hypothetical protein MLAC_39800 [Mycobacterium lacus]
MSRIATSFRKVYGAHPVHLLTMVSGFALLAYIVVTVKPAELWDRGTWWQSIAVWFVAAVVGHDLVLFPLYTLADRVLAGRVGRRQSPSARRCPSGGPKVPVRNYIRIPALAAGLTLLVFLPGIIEQGAPTYLAATGQTQQPFLGRWLLLTAAMFAISAVAYGGRWLIARRRNGG